MGIVQKEARQEKEWNGLALLKPLASQAVFISSPPPDLVFRCGGRASSSRLRRSFLFAAAPRVFVAPALFLADTIVVFHRVLLDWSIASAPPLFMMGGLREWRYEMELCGQLLVKGYAIVSANSEPRFSRLAIRLACRIILTMPPPFSSAGRMARLKCGGG